MSCDKKCGKGSCCSEDVNLEYCQWVEPELETPPQSYILSTTTNSVFYEEDTAEVDLEDWRSEVEFNEAVVEGYKFLVDNNIPVFSSDFGKRIIHFTFQAECVEDNKELTDVSVGISIHNPVDGYSKEIGDGLAGFSLKHKTEDFGLFVYRTAWKSLNAIQKILFVENWLMNLCMMEQLPVSRRAAMGGR
jgi:hypothetical protein